jgi:hypothetical protein
MMLLTGEVRKVIFSDYKNKNNETINQGILIIEPENSRQNYEVYLNATQLKTGVRDTWQSLKGKTATVAVSLFVNYEYKFHKFNAIGDAQPYKGKLG